MYTVLYDITQAYDKIPWRTIAYCLHRLHIPFQFIKLVINILKAPTARLRTELGDTEPVSIRRGVPQGDPIAPLLFIIALDPLFDALSLSTCGIPAHLDGPRIPAAAYADDFTTINTSADQCKLAHEIVCAFTQWAHLTLSAKTQSQTSQPAPRGKRVALPAPLLLTLPNQETPIPQAGIGEPIHILGVPHSADLDPTHAPALALKKFNWLCAMAESANPPLSDVALRTFIKQNIFAEIEHISAVVSLASGTTLSKMNTRMADCIRRVAKAGFTRIKAQAAATVFRIPLPEIEH